MKKNNATLAGSLHPILFFAGVYVVALFLSIFICSAIFYSINPAPPSEISQSIADNPDAGAKDIANTATVASLK
jgi:hypothetical protein